MAVSLALLRPPPMASLSLLTKTTSMPVAMAHPSLSVSCGLRSDFLSTNSLSFRSASSSFSGLSLTLNFNLTPLVKRNRTLQVRAGKKYALCQTKRNRSRKSLARTHGFRRRMRTTSGRAVLQRRRAKGRKVLCTKTNPSSGKRA